MISEKPQPSTRTLIDWEKELPKYLATGPIIPQEEAAICREAVTLLEQSRKQGAEIVAAAQQEFERQKKLGMEQGLKEGRDAAVVHHLKTVLASLDYYEQSRSQLVGVVTSCLRRLIMDLPPEERIYQLVGQALDAFKQQTRLILQINAKDQEAVEAAIAKLQPRMPAGSTIEVRLHEELTPGSCVLESPLGLVDASLESQLAILENSLLAAAKS
ncbi:MAG: HrpE/YscL family type III secretion apparatus protein [Verrucomicrobia bacterium]|nr:HrpE/YscL family type III secretion apparatus protein [Verrucomicrobiota bacterium]